jgi:hypothetical protein
MTFGMGRENVSGRTEGDLRRGFDDLFVGIQDPKADLPGLKKRLLSGAKKERRTACDDQGGR